ncbi:MAG TPA: hypothetical protein VGF48_01900 [Thermoanaerobaculia bacterium]|jgi:hypothetical protein
MTRYRLDHAVVMDTDDIPGRGGYAVVGISRGVSQAERLFVAQNFGISDFLHDPQNDRTFYSFFRVPGGRRAFTRRFANGRRRNGTQNRLFVHTLFFDDALFDGLGGLPWLLLEGNVRAEGSGEWQPLRNDVPWVGDEAMPLLEAEVDERVIDDVPRRLEARFSLAAKDVPNAADTTAGVIAALRDQKRVTLPQGRGYEWLTLLAWSMLPRRDREELAWTQHDTLNISAVTFHLANAVAASDALSPAPIAKTIVERNLHDWRAFHETAARYALTIRHPDTLEACFAHRDAVRDLKGDLASLTRVADSAKRLRGQPCFDREAVLDLVWRQVPVPLLRKSGLAEALLQDPPNSAWLDRAADPNVVVDFFLAASDASIAAVAEWAAGRVSGGPLARLITRAYQEKVPSRRELLARLDDPEQLQCDSPELAYDAIALALERNATSFLRRSDLWLAPLLQHAQTLDQSGDTRARRAFITDVQQLEIDVESFDVQRAGACTRALILAARPWHPRMTTLFWSHVPMEDITQLPADAIDALAELSAAARKKLAEIWLPRLRNLPKDVNGERLLALLFSNTDGAELRAGLALRDVEQGSADESTLNRLDVALHEWHGPKYEREMVTALTRFAGPERLTRIRRLCTLLASPRVLPTVKRIIEAHVLPQALQALQQSDWNQLAGDDHVFARGPATLTIAYKLGAHGDDDAVQQFESAYRTRRRNDAAESLAAGRRNRPRGRRTR